MVFYHVSKDIVLMILWLIFIFLFKFWNDVNSNLYDVVVGMNINFLVKTDTKLECLTTYCLICLDNSTWSNCLFRPIGLDCPNGGGSFN